MARIYTKTGDKGKTGLIGGKRVGKDSLRIAAIGDVDELNAALGFAASLEPDSETTALIRPVQSDLFSLGAALASPESVSRSRLEKATGRLERVIDALEEGVEPLRNFVLPGGSPAGACLHWARAVCRRAERAVVGLSRAEPVPPEAVTYLNRLSDFLFVLARTANKRSNVEEVKWSAETDA